MSGEYETASVTIETPTLTTRDVRDELRDGAVDEWGALSIHRRTVITAALNAKLRAVADDVDVWDMGNGHGYATTSPSVTEWVRDTCLTDLVDDYTEHTDEVTEAIVMAAWRAATPDDHDADPSKGTLGANYTGFVWSIA